MEYSQKFYCKTGKLNDEYVWMASIYIYVSLLQPLLMKINIFINYSENIHQSIVSTTL